MTPLAIKKLFDFFYEYRRLVGKKIYIAVFLVFLSTVLDAIGFFILLPLLIYASDGSLESSGNQTVGENFFVEFISSLNLNFTEAIIVVILIFALKSFFKFLSQYLLVFLKNRVINTFKMSLINNYSSINFEYYLGKSSGHFINIINEQVHEASMAFSSMILSINSLISTFVYIGFAIYADIYLGAAVLVVIFPLLYLFNFVNRRTQILSEKRVSSTTKLNQTATEFFKNFKYLKSVNKLNFFKKIFEKNTKSLSKVIFQQGVLSALIKALIEPILIITLLVVVIFQVNVREAPLESILIFLAMMYRGVSTSLNIQKKVQRMLELSGSYQILLKEINDAKNNAEIYPDRKLTFKNSIRFKKVAYTVNNEQLLKDIDFEIQKGSIVSIVGMSGSGKSSLLSMFSKLITPSEGEIFIDSTNINKISNTSLRDSISYVGQDVSIFSGTLLQNIDLDSFINKNGINHSKIEEVSKYANIDEFVYNLRNNFSEIVLENGSNFSGGQKQRIAFARELYRNTEIFLLDEVTSGLDPVSEMKICKTIQQFRKKYTTIIATHSKELMLVSDYVILLSKGRIVEIGKPEKLIKSNSSQLKKIFNYNN